MHLRPAAYSKAYFPLEKLWDVLEIVHLKWIGVQSVAWRVSAAALSFPVLQAESWPNLGRHKLVKRKKKILCCQTWLTCPIHAPFRVIPLLTQRESNPPRCLQHVGNCGSDREACCAPSTTKTRMMMKPLTSLNRRTLTRRPQVWAAGFFLFLFFLGTDCYRVSSCFLFFKLRHSEGFLNAAVACFIKYFNKYK